MTKNDREDLVQFFGAYFHHDWALDSTTSSGVVDRYIADAPDKSELAKLANHLIALSDGCSTDKELEGILAKDLYCNFVPSQVGLGAKAWVRQIAEQLRSASLSS